ncbi:MAG: OmpA family protein [Desulfobacterales bacterium]|nr:OmpA family protein [Desulfobacterales bacterium]
MRIKSFSALGLLLLMVAVLPAQGAPSASTEPSVLNLSGPENAGQVVYQTMEDGRLLVSVTDQNENPIKGLTVKDFGLRQGTKTAKIVSVEPLATSKEVPLNIVLVVDNSKSMRIRKAIEPLRSALNAFYEMLRPIDQITAVIFDEKQTSTVHGRPLHARVLQTSDEAALRAFLSASMSSGLTEGTYLMDALMAGLDAARAMPAKQHKILVVLSDGEDINSAVTKDEVERAAQGIPNFSAFAVDYMPTPEMDPFLSQLADGHDGRAWKAASATELPPIFEALSSTMLHRYIVAYRLLEPPTGQVAFAAPELTIEEITTIDSSPLLNQIYFGAGQSELTTDRYVLFQNQGETAGFDEKKLKGALEKYRHVLNIIGSRMQRYPETTLRLVGCNANLGPEKGRKDLSLSRAESVRAYLRYVWGIEPKRLTVEPRNLPEKPSTNRIAEGQAENQRVEIYADQEAILDTVDSAYVQKVTDLGQLRIFQQIQSEAGISVWRLNLRCGGREIRTIKGQGALPTEWAVPLEGALLDEMAACEKVDMQFQAIDTEANELNKTEAASLPIHFVQRTQQATQTQGYRVKEQYALILFDYDSAAIKARNKTIVERIIKRMQAVPEASIAVTGHTDTIGSEAYNTQLSERRAQAVQASIIEADVDTAARLDVLGIGPNSPLYDNTAPEGRALNRTVTITLEYMQKG